MCSASWLQIEVKRVTAVQVGIFLKKKIHKGSENFDQIHNFNLTANYNCPTAIKNKFKKYINYMYQV